MAICFVRSIRPPPFLFPSVIYNEIDLHLSSSFFSLKEILIKWDICKNIFSMQKAPKPENPRLRACFLSFVMCFVSFVRLFLSWIRLCHSAVSKNRSISAHNSATPVFFSPLKGINTSSVPNPNVLRITDRCFGIWLRLSLSDFVAAIMI